MGMQRDFMYTTIDLIQFSDEATYSVSIFEVKATVFYQG